MAGLGLPAVGPIPAPKSEVVTLAVAFVLGCKPSSYSNVIVVFSPTVDLILTSLETLSTSPVVNPSNAFPENTPVLGPVSIRSIGIRSTTFISVEYIFAKPTIVSTFVRLAF